MTDTDSRGILTETDRKWLNDEIEYEQRQSAADRRQAIRQRVHTALQDFAVLNEKWSPEERQKVMDEIDDPEQVGANVLEFLYLLLNEPATEPEEMIGDDAVDRALAFRRSLSQGIRAGKEHFDEVSDPVLIDSNVELFETPSVDDLQRTIDTDDWRGANDYARGAFNTEDDTVIDKEEAAQTHHMNLHLSVQEDLYRRRQRSITDINRHDELVGSLHMTSNREETHE